MQPIRKIKILLIFVLSSAETRINLLYVFLDMVDDAICLYLYGPPLEYTLHIDTDFSSLSFYAWMLVFVNLSTD